MSIPTYDCVIIGAGFAGRAAAWSMARRGIGTLLVDARQSAESGADWINGVDLEGLRSIGLPAWPAGLRFSKAHRFVLQVANGEGRVEVADSPLTEVDMRVFCDWLLALAVERGAETRFGARARLGETDAQGRIVELGETRVRARCVVWATGLEPQAARASARDSVDICTAYQGVWAVRDPAAARAWLGEQGVRPGELLSLVGVEGGWSVTNVCIDEDLSHAAILTGTLHRDGYRSGVQISQDFGRSVSWLGERQRGSGGLIPLRSWRGQLVEDRLMYCGDAAGQVFPLHGSGVAPSLAAAELMGDALQEALRRGRLDAAGLWSYASGWQRTGGARSAVYQPFRCLAAGLTPAQTSAMIRARIMTPASIRAGLAQAAPVVDPTSIPHAVRAISELAPMFPRLVRTAALSARLADHHRRFPATFDAAAVARWQARTDELMRATAALAGR